MKISPSLSKVNFILQIAASAHDQGLKSAPPDGLSCGLHTHLAMPPISIKPFPYSQSLNMYLVLFFWLNLTDTMSYLF